MRIELPRPRAPRPRLRPAPAHAPSHPLHTAARALLRLEHSLTPKPVLQSRLRRIVICDTGLMIQTRCEQKTRSADSMWAWGGSGRSRGSEREMCSVAGILAMVERRSNPSSRDPGMGAGTPDASSHVPVRR